MKEQESSSRKPHHSIEGGGPELAEALVNITAIADNMKLEPFDTDFKVVPAEVIYEIASYGIPGRYSHWTHGRAYESQKTSYDYGLSKIYELVINTNPSSAFLLVNNSKVQNMLVMAHVLGHTDFFNKNPAFTNTNRNMDDTARLHADRIRQYEFENGSEEVESFLDAALSIEYNVDRTYERDWSASEYLAEMRQKFKERQEQKKRRLTDYDDLFDKPKVEDKPLKVSFPVGEEEDLLGLIATFSPKPLEPWQVDILKTIRNEAYYFIPQMETKIMNEGWAVRSHCRIADELFARDQLTQGEAWEWAALNAGVARPNPHRPNPYHLGWQVYENTQRLFEGKPHPDGKIEKDWQGNERKLSYFEGRDEYDVFWIRETVAHDQEFLRLYLTDNLIEDLNLYSFGLKGEQWVKDSYDPEEVRKQILTSLQYMPVIHVPEDGADYKGNRELYMKHAWEGVDLDAPWAERTLQHIYKLWGKPVYLENMQGGDKMLFSCSDGKVVEKKVLEKKKTEEVKPITKHIFPP